MEKHLYSIGLVLLLLAASHLIFPRYFNWKEELPKLSLINRQMMSVHTLFIALFVALNGLLCISSGDLLIQTELGHRICFGLAIFWTLRALIQFFGYSSELWKGKRLETAVHIVFSLFWPYMSMVFWGIALSDRV
jgi:hypothetical protein